MPRADRSLSSQASPSRNSGGGRCPMAGGPWLCRARAQPRWAARRRCRYTARTTGTRAHLAIVCWPSSCCCPPARRSPARLRAIVISSRRRLARWACSAPSPHSRSRRGGPILAVCGRSPRRTTRSMRSSPRSTRRPPGQPIWWRGSIPARAASGWAVACSRWDAILRPTKTPTPNKRSPRRIN